jgi:hypothetical protein
MNMQVTFGHNKDEASEQFRYYIKRYIAVCTGGLFH